MATTSTPLTKESNDALHRGPTKRAIRYLDTASAYDLWAEVYDTDGNFLQALDSIEMETLLPDAISMLTSTASTKTRAVDLGCGTGRNTLKLLDFPQISDVVAMDLSPKMLEIAKQRCIEKLNTSTGPSASAPQPTLSFDTYDMIATPTPPSILTAPPPSLIISTLVLEHIPLPTFFATVTQILAPGGILLLTNMHAEMGSISQAGFVDPKTGDKIRPTSYAHTVADTVAEAEKWELEVVRRVKEVRMGEELKGRLGVRSEKWVGIDVWFGGIWRRKMG